MYYYLGSIQVSLPPSLALHWHVVPYWQINQHVGHFERRRGRHQMAAVQGLALGSRPIADRADGQVRMGFDGGADGVAHAAEGAGDGDAPGGGGRLGHVSP